MTALGIVYGLAAACAWFGLLALIAAWFNNREAVAEAARAAFRARIARHVPGALR